MSKNLEFHQSYTVSSIRKIHTEHGNYHIGVLPSGKFGVYKYFIRRDPHTFYERDWHRVKTLESLDEAIAYCNNETEY